MFCAIFYFGRINLKDKTPIYYNTAEYALVNGEVEQYWASFRANVSCKEVIEVLLETTTATTVSDMALYSRY